MKIAQVMKSESWGEITPAAFDRGIGGREGAMVRLATEWAKQGHEVTTFVPIKKAVRFDELAEKVHPRNPDATPALFRKHGFHEYVSINLSQGMLRSFPYDAVVAWECPSVFDHADILEKQKIRLVHMQVAHFNEGEQEAAEKLSTGVVALSEWARDFLVHDGLSVDGSKLFVRPNGVNIFDYPTKKKSDKISFVYSSSPDRGLWHLLKMWPKIRKKYSSANLFVAYGVKRYTEDMRWAHSRVGEMCVEIDLLMQQPGVVDLGKIGQKQLAQIQMNATAWLYPADTIQATETGCITAIENMAAGNPCVMTDADCLESEFQDVSLISPLPFHEEDFLEGVAKALYPSYGPELAAKARKFAETRDWSLIAPTWIDLFKEQNA